jgi:hypothetical protein
MLMRLLPEPAMAENEWLTCTAPTLMLKLLRGKASG